MVFIINRLKYDTDKMKLISEKCKYTYETSLFGVSYFSNAHNVKLWKSNNDRWLVTYTYSEIDSDRCGIALDTEDAKKLLLKYDYKKYEELFDDIEEA